MPGVVHEVPAPRKIPFCAAQSAWLSWWQVTPVEVVMQQAPVVVVEQIPAVLHEVPLPR